MKRAFAVPLLLLVAYFAQATDTKPKHCSDPSLAQPQYPEALRGSGVSGTVVMQVDINDRGCTLGVMTVHKLNPALDKLAKQAVESWQFKPATKDGKPVRVMVEIKMDFKDPGR